MHFIGLRKELAAAHPGLAARVFAAFVEAKRIGYAEVAAIAAAGANKVTLPWFAAELEATRALMGEDFWSYGVEPNRAELEAVCRYSQEQYLAERALTVDELFAPETLEMRGF
jgi:4,5-dihydroxyphthalate decarboxylase